LGYIVRREKENLGILISADVLRLLKRKKARGEVAEALTREKIERLLKDFGSYETVSRMANEIILARRIANAIRQAKGCSYSKAQIKEVT